jgi:tetrahydromethanopterin S-methyltransferase subunit B
MRRKSTHVNRKFTYNIKEYSRVLYSKLLMLLFFAVAIAGCKKTSEEVGLIGICPAVVSTNPASGAINVVTNKKLTVTFNVPMDAAAVNSTSFLLYDGATQIFGTVISNGAEATFIPSNLLSANTVYTATITSKVKDLVKNAMPTNYVWSFNTGSTPIVVSTDPANGATDVFLSKVVNATFSTAMDPSTLNPSTFTVKQGATIILGTISYSGLVASFTPTVPFLPNTLYTCLITTGAKDVAGNAKASNYTWSFATSVLPIVTSTDPANNAKNVALNKVITTTFNKAMDANTINTNSFIIRNGSTQIAGVITYSGNTTTFTTTLGLEANTTYIGTITTAVKDVAGNSLESNYVWNFKTGNTPVVISTDPANAATNVALNKAIKANFSTAMDPSTINNSSFLLREGTNATSGTVSYSGTTATFTPTSPLSINTVYTATITTIAKDEFGHALASNYVWAFSTAGSPPTVISTDPANGATNVPVNKILTATFSTPMNPSSLNVLSYTLREGSNTVFGSVTYAGSTATFTPANNLSTNTVYTATITTSATDLNGNNLVNNYTWSFTTVGNPPSPTVISTDPANAATNVSLSKIVTANFSTTMNPATINVLSFTIKQGTNTVFGNVTYSGTTATFSPASDFAPNTLYIATITTSARDLNGNSIANNYVWNFTTLPITVIPPSLGTVNNFGAFGGSAGVTNQGINTVINNGGLGTTAASSLITGFHDGLTGDIYTETPLNVGLVTGGIFTAPPFPGSATSQAIATQALLDATNTYFNISPANKPGGIDPGAGELGGLTLTPGIYKSAGGTFKITNGDLTLDAQGNPNAVWIFQAPSSLTVGTAGPAGARSISLINGALAKNVFWYVGSNAVINGAGGGIMAGTIIANSGVTFSTAGNNVQTILNGRAISLVSSVTMVNTTINVQ